MMLGEMLPSCAPCLVPAYPISVPDAYLGRDRTGWESAPGLLADTAWHRLPRNALMRLSDIEGKWFPPSFPLLLTAETPFVSQYFCCWSPVHNLEDDAAISVAHSLLQFLDRCLFNTGDSAGACGVHPRALSAFSAILIEIFNEKIQFGHGRYAHATATPNLISMVDLLYLTIFIIQITCTKLKPFVPAWHPVPASVLNFVPRGVLLPLLPSQLPRS